MNNGVYNLTLMSLLLDEEIADLFVFSLGVHVHRFREAVLWVFECLCVTVDMVEWERANVEGVRKLPTKTPVAKTIVAKTIVGQAPQAAAAAVAAAEAAEAVEAVAAAENKKGVVVKEVELIVKSKDDGKATAEKTSGTSTGGSNSSLQTTASTTEAAAAMTLMTLKADDNLTL